MEGCGSCHYWGRLARSYGHEVRIISPKKVKAFLQGQKTDANDALAAAAIQLGMRFYPVKEVEGAKSELVKQLEPCQWLMDLEGVGTGCASMLYASLGDGREFKNGRNASVCIGLTPKQHSSGGKVYMVGIDKHGDNKELRVALYQRPLSVMSRLPDEPITLKQKWLLALVKRAGVKRTCISKQDHPSCLGTVQG
ncbi:MAG: transposase [Gammaproteobacteria bacterium]|jgi:transposase